MLNLKDKIVRSRAPLRIGLAGGGTDLKDFFSKYNGAVLNVAIKKYAFTEISFSDEYLILFSSDLNIIEKINLSNIDSHKTSLQLHLFTYRYIMKKYNKNKLISAKITTFCDAPIGSGLGSSSTLVVSMIKAWSEVLNLGLDEYTIAEDAILIERFECGFKGGYQDQYSASFGGFNFIEFLKNQTIVHPLRVKNWFQCEIESSMILHYTGQSRISSNIIDDQITFINSIQEEKIRILKLMKENAYLMKNSLLKNNFSEIIKYVKLANSYKNKTSERITSRIIKEREEFGINNGALASKVSGAGGGGFILFISEPKNILNLRDKLGRFSNQTFFVSICHDSVQSWIV